MLNLLSLKDVDDIILGAPYFITETFIKDFNISAVVEGRIHKDKPETGDDPFEVPKKMNIYHEVDSGTDFSISKLISRVQSHHKDIEEAIERKKAKQDVYYEFDSKREKKVVEIQ